MGDEFRFVPLAKIASGGTATVFVGAPRTGSLRALVALKRPHPHILDDARQRETLLREARVASSLHHPNLVEVRAVEVVGDELQLVMDYVEGATLGTLIATEARAGARLPPGVATRIVLDACAGLEAVHDQRDVAGRLLGLVHRDVSPQNILIGVDGIARLTDFGLAKAVYEGAPSTTQGTLKGKLGYMAPEYVSRGHLDRAVDVFAMGVVLWEALAARRLFRGDNEAQTLDRVLREDPIALASLDPALAPLDAVVSKAVAKDPGARFSSAGAFAVALEQTARQMGALATREEVAAFVLRVAGNDLTERRAIVAKARGQRSRRALLARGGVVLGAGALLIALVAVGLASVSARGRSEGSSLVQATDGGAPAVPIETAATPALSSVPFAVDVDSLPLAPPALAPATSARARAAASAPHALPPNPYVHRTRP